MFNLIGHGCRVHTHVCVEFEFKGVSLEGLSLMQFYASFSTYFMDIIGLAWARPCLTSLKLFVT